MFVFVLFCSPGDGGGGGGANLKPSAFFTQKKKIVLKF